MQLDIERWVKRRRIRRDEVKSLPVTKGMVYDAYRKVKSNCGASGVDGQSLTDFEGDLSNQLYKLWSRLSSGSYFLPAVKRVTIPKRGGGQRPLGIPTVGDRVAQTVLKEFMEPRLER
ncbi:MAG: retron-type reverse transcriptase, partial [Neolewinella sp.]